MNGEGRDAARFSEHQPQGEKSTAVLSFSTGLVALAGPLLWLMSQVLECDQEQLHRGGKVAKLSSSEKPPPGYQSACAPLLLTGEKRSPKNAAASGPMVEKKL